MAELFNYKVADVQVLPSSRGVVSSEVGCGGHRGDKGASEIGLSGHGHQCSESVSKIAVFGYFNSLEETYLMFMYRCSTADMSSSMTQT